MRSNKVRVNAAKTVDITRSQKWVFRRQLLLLRWSILRAESRLGGLGGFGDTQHGLSEI